VSERFYRQVMLEATERRSSFVCWIDEEHAVVGRTLNLVDLAGKWRVREVYVRAPRERVDTLRANARDMRDVLSGG
jgi:hypothetical protein